MIDPILHKSLIIKNFKYCSLFIEEFKSTHLFEDYNNSLIAFDSFYREINKNLSSFVSDKLKLYFHIELNGKSYISFHFTSHLSRRCFSGTINISDTTEDFTIEKHKSIPNKSLDTYNKEIIYIKNLLIPLKEFLLSIENYILDNVRLYHKQLQILNKFKPYDITWQRENIKKFFYQPKKDILKSVLNTYNEKGHCSLHSINFQYEKDYVFFQKLLWTQDEKDILSLEVSVNKQLKNSNLVANLIFHPLFSNIYDFDKPTNKISISELSSHINLIKNIEDF